MVVIVVIASATSLVTAQYGFKDRVDGPDALRLALGRGLTLDVSDPSCYVSRMAQARRWP